MANRFRKIRMWGNSLVLVLSPVDIKDLGIKNGDYIDISDSVILSEEVYNLTKSKEVKNDKKNN